jgi:hypothetical protein
MKASLSIRCGLSENVRRIATAYLPLPSAYAGNRQLTGSRENRPLKSGGRSREASRHTWPLAAGSFFILQANDPPIRRLGHPGPVWAAAHPGNRAGRLPMVEP